jgi:hypothetical protein
MAIYVNDTFTESAATDLTAHSPDTGTSWTEVFNDSTLKAIINTANDVVEASGGQNSKGMAYSAEPDPTSSEYQIQFDVAVNETGSGTKPVGAFARRTDNSNFYSFQILPAGNSKSDRKLFKEVAGVTTELASSDQGASSGQTFLFIITDAKKSVEQDGSEILSTSDNALSSAGDCGLYWGNFNGSGDGGHIRATWELDNFTSEDIPSSTTTIDAGTISAAIPVQAANIETTEAASISASLAAQPSSSKSSELGSITATVPPQASVIEISEAAQITANNPAAPSIIALTEANAISASIPPPALIIELRETTTIAAAAPAVALAAHIYEIGSIASALPSVPSTIEITEVAAITANSPTLPALIATHDAGAISASLPAQPTVAHIYAPTSITLSQPAIPSVIETRAAGTISASTPTEPPLIETSEAATITANMPHSQQSKRLYLLRLAVLARVSLF